MRKINLGFLVTGSAHFDPKWARESKKTAHTFLNTLDVNLVQAEDVVTDLADLAREMDGFKKAALDLLIVQPGSFTWDNIIAYVAQHLPEVPLILWAIKEPPMSGGGLEVNSLCSAMMNGVTLAKLGKKFLFVYGDTDDSRVCEPIRRMVRVIAAIKALRETRVGLVGYRPTGFYGSTFNELAIRRAVGVEMEHIALSSVFEAYGAVAERDVLEDIEAVKSAGYLLKESVKEGLENSSRLYLAVRKCIEDASVSGLAVKCWPEMLSRDLLPCFVNSRLSDEGIPVACEADVRGLVTQLMQTSLTGQPTFFCDLVEIDESRNSVLLWHCGACPSRMAKNQDAVTLELLPSRKKEWKLTCPIVEFPLRAGVATICRFCELNNKYRLFIATGQALETSQDIRGNCCWVKLDADARGTIEFIVNNHVEHHFSMSYGNLTDDLLTMCSILDIEPLIVD